MALMAKITYARTSPYSATPQSAWYLGLYEHRRIPPNSDDAPFEITAAYQYRPDKLSQDLYGRPDLWWVFYVRNLKVMRDPINSLTAGKIIILPSFEHIKTILGL
jgi:hypothetical protein